MADEKKQTKSSGVKVILRGSQYGGKDGDERTVDAETADRLVRAGTARYAGKE